MYVMWQNRVDIDDKKISKIVLFLIKMSFNIIKVYKKTMIFVLNNGFLYIKEDDNTHDKYMEIFYTNLMFISIVIIDIKRHL